MARPPASISARLLCRSGAVIAALVAAVSLAQLPQTSAAFLASTASGGSSFAAATSFCSTPGSVTQNVVNDTMVVQKSPTTTYGSANPIEVRSHVADNKRVLVRPSLPTVPPGCTLTSAVLTFTVVGFRGGRTYLVHRAATNWSINTATWNNQPAPVGASTSGTVTNTTWSVNVTGPVQGLYDSGINTGLIVRDSVEDSAADLNSKFASLDGTGTPARVTFTFG